MTQGAARSRLRTRLPSGDEGNAIVEFVFLAVLLLVPLVYLLLTVFRVQAAAYAVSSAAREAGRVFTTTTSSDGAPDRAFLAAAMVMRDSGLDLAPRQLHIQCAGNPCLTPGATVDVSIAYQVALPLVPRVFRGSAPATVRVTSDHVEVVDRFRASR